MTARAFLAPRLSLFCGTGDAARTTHLVFRDEDRAVPVAPDLGELLTIAAFEGLDADHAAAAPLIRRGLLHLADDPADPSLRRAIEALDRPFRWALDDRAAPLADAALAFHSARRVLHVDCWQLPILPESAARRALAVHALGGEDALLVGDDDLLSLLLASLGWRVWVVDVDPDLLRMITGLAERAGYRIGTVAHDLRRPGLPEALARVGAPSGFDAVVTDPVYSPRGADLFVSRALHAARPGGHVLVAFGGYCRAFLEERLAAWGLEPEGVQVDAGHYYNPYRLEVDVITSDLYALRRPAALRGVAPPGASFEGDLVLPTWRIDLTLLAERQAGGASLDALIELAARFWPELELAWRAPIASERGEAVLARGAKAVWLSAAPSRLTLFAIGLPSEPAGLVEAFRALPGAERARLEHFPRGPGAEHECFLRTHLWRAPTSRAVSGR